MSNEPSSSIEIQGEWQYIHTPAVTPNLSTEQYEKSHRAFLKAKKKHSFGRDLRLIQGKWFKISTKFHFSRYDWVKMGVKYTANKYLKSTPAELVVSFGPFTTTTSFSK
jgi:hypothetical protein